MQWFDGKLYKQCQILVVYTFEYLRLYNIYKKEKMVVSFSRVYHTVTYSGRFQMRTDSRN